MENKEIFMEKSWKNIFSSMWKSCLHFSICVFILSFLSVNKIDQASVSGSYLQPRVFFNNSRKNLSYLSYFFTCQEWQLCISKHVLFDPHPRTTKKILRRMTTTERRATRRLTRETGW